MFKAFTKYVFVVFLLVASCGQSFARAYSFEHANSDCVTANSSTNSNLSTTTSSTVAVSASRKPRVHATHELESSQDALHANHTAHTTVRMSAEETGTMAMSTNDKMAMNDGNCCFDECMCDTSTCSNASLVALTRHTTTAPTCSEHVVAEQRGKPKSISSSLFRPPIIG